MHPKQDVDSWAREFNIPETEEKYCNENWPFILLEAAVLNYFLREKGVTHFKNGKQLINRIERCLEFVESEREYARRDKANGGHGEPGDDYFEKLKPFLNLV